MPLKSARSGGMPPAFTGNCVTAGKPFACDANPVASLFVAGIMFLSLRLQRVFRINIMVLALLV